MLPAKEDLCPRLVHYVYRASLSRSCPGARLHRHHHTAPPRTLITLLLFVLTTIFYSIVLLFFVSRTLRCSALLCLHLPIHSRGEASLFLKVFVLARCREEKKDIRRGVFRFDAARCTLPAWSTFICAVRAFVNFVEVELTTLMRRRR